MKGGEEILLDLKAEAYTYINRLDNNNYYNIKNPTVIYDRNNKVISTFETSGIPMSYKDINPLLIQTYVIIEDSSFFTNIGIDLKGTIRSIISTLSGNQIQGGSTITQQVLKNTFLSEYSDIERKILEWYLAPNITEKLPKEKIMEIYLNQNSYGNNTIGIEEASLFYFNKSNKDLLPHEIALIVALSNNPTYYNPINNKEIAKEKRNIILNKMYTEGLISYEESIKYQNTDIIIYGKHNSSNISDLTTTALIQASEELMKLNGFKFKYIFSSKEEYDSYKKDYNDKLSFYINDIKKGGYTIYTSLDKDLTEKASRIVMNYISKQKLGDIQVSVTTVDTKTFKPIIVLGSKDNSGNYNRALSSYRQPGSSIKPIAIYAPAYELIGLNNNTIYSDSRLNNNYPYNYNRREYGNQTLLDAIAISNNVIPFKIGTELGMNNILYYLEKFRFKGLSYLDNDNYSIALGGFTYGTNTYELSQAFASLHDGSYMNTSSINKIIINGMEVFDGSKEYREQIFNDITTEQIKEALTKVMTSGTGASVNLTGSYGKTGTSNSNIDGTFVGYYNGYTTAVWVGHDNPKPIKGLGGGTYPANIWKTINLEIERSKKS